jgi:uncharacterized protein YndB with AHSA1/START domain
MAHYRFSIRVAAPPDQVFDLWTNLERMSEWTGGVTRVTDLTGPIDQPGTRYTVWFGRIRSQTEIIDVLRPHHVRTRFGNVLLRGESAATFEAENGGTHLTEEFRTQGVISAITARVFATGSYRGSFRGELATFRDLAEREAQSPAESVDFGR